VSVAVTVAGAAELMDELLSVTRRLGEPEPLPETNCTTWFAFTDTPLTVVVATTVSAPTVEVPAGETKAVALPSAPVAAVAASKARQPPCVLKRTTALGTRLPRMSRTVAFSPPASPCSRKSCP
jgi:hypothetical protein